MKYLVMYQYTGTTYVSGAKSEDYRDPQVTVQKIAWEYFDDLKKAAEFRSAKSGVLLKNLEYTVDEVKEKE